MKKSVLFFLFGFVIFLFLFGYSFGALFETSNQADFDEGNYSNTFYNSTEKHVQLDLSIENISSGNYTSKVFDAGFYAIWNNISWYHANVSENLTNLSVQIKSSDNTSNLGDFHGPGNSTNNYYITNNSYVGNYVNNTVENLSVKGRYFQYRFFFITVQNIDYNFSPLLYNVTLDANTLSSSLNVSLVSPSDGTAYTSTNNITFSYNVNSVLDVTNCSLILNNAVDTIDYSIDIDIVQTFSKIGVSNGNYNWTVNCTDVNNFGNSSEKRTFSVNYTPEEDGDDNDGNGDDIGGGTDTTIKKVIPAKKDNKTNVSDSNITSNYTAGNITSPEFETAEANKFLFTGLFAGIGAFGDDFGIYGSKFIGFVYNNLISVVLMSFFVVFVFSRTIYLNHLKYIDFRKEIKRVRIR